MKSELQTVKKGNDSIIVYLQRIKEARNFLSAAEVIFCDDGIVILTLNGLPAEYNTIRSMIRGRENVISLKSLPSQLLVEEAMVENVSVNPMLSALVANTNDFTTKSGGNSSSSGYKSFNNKNKGKFNQSFNSSMQTYQICGKYNYLVDTCRFRNALVNTGCQIYSKNNHFADTYRLRNNASSQGCFICGNPHRRVASYVQISSYPMNALYTCYSYVPSEQNGSSHVMSSNTRTKWAG